MNPDATPDVMEEAVAYVQDNDDRRLTRPPRVSVGGTGHATWIWEHAKPKRKKKQPLGFAPQAKGRAKKK